MFVNICTVEWPLRQIQDPVHVYIARKIPPLVTPKVMSEEKGILDASYRLRPSTISSSTESKNVYPQQCIPHINLRQPLRKEERDGGEHLTHPGNHLPYCFHLKEERQFDLPLLRSRVNLHKLEV